MTTNAPTTASSALSPLPADGARNTRQVPTLPLDTVTCGDALEWLRGLADESVHCIVTSPPYWGLRDYGVGGQIGLEPTYQEHIAALVLLFREARRVLRSDGVCWVNYGDCYASASGAQREQSYGSDGKAKRGSTNRDWSSENHDDGRTSSWWSRIVDTDCRHVHEQVLELCLQIQAYTQSLLGHLPNADYFLRQEHRQSLVAILDRSPSLTRAVEQLLGVHQSTTDLSVPQPPGGLTLVGMLSACLSSLRSLASYVHQSACTLDDSSKTVDCNQGNASLCAVLVDHIQCISGYCSLVSTWLTLPYVQPQYTTKPLKPKDLAMLPHRLAIALQDDGWWVRADIIWSKPNPMPESVTDRPTKAHEYVFLLTKSERYFYDAEAIKEPCVRGHAGSTYTNGKTAAAKEGSPLRPVGTGPRTDKQAATGKRQYDGFNDRWDASPTTSRNKRSVWTVATEPTPEAHFATFPTKLIEPMILAGCPARVCAVCGAPWKREVSVSYENPGNRKTNGPRSLERRHETAGFAQRLERHSETLGWCATCTCNGPTDSGIVLDMFFGSGTTGRVARRWGRHFLGCDLNPAYVEMAERLLAVPYTIDMYAAVR